jgi:hypothetical protein
MPAIDLTVSSGAITVTFTELVPQSNGLMLFWGTPSGGRPGSVQWVGVMEDRIPWMRVVQNIQRCTWHADDPPHRCLTAPLCPCCEAAMEACIQEKVEWGHL